MLIIHSKIAWILSKAYHVAGSGSMEGNGSKEGKGQGRSKESPSRRSCHSCRDGSTNNDAGEPDLRRWQGR